MTLSEEDFEESGVGPRRAGIVKIGKHIVSGDRGFRPGDVLRIEYVIDLLGCSRPLTREILQVLQHKGLVTLKARTGATVEPIDRWNVFDRDVIEWRLDIAPRFQMRSLTELREAVEPRAAFLAAQRASADVCRDLVSLALEFKSIGEAPEFDLACRERYRRVDEQFHRMLLQGSQNEMFSALVDQVTRAVNFRIEKEWAGAPRPYGEAPAGDERSFDPVPGSRKRFPRRPEPLALWFHFGLAYAVEQGLPYAAETFARAVLAEFHNGYLSNPDLLDALARALHELDLGGMREADREPFHLAIVGVLRSRDER
ncbi:FadR/GntR family transcriptional regulator [Actinoplanes sp. NPDC049668]|uniref:FadR/GntR family transcriptional regulator n=1 Tax=unclassified Actinoplanes TaxID=2626549 RepID=UPI0033A1BF94